jgi:phage gpG-like protein
MRIPERILGFLQKVDWKLLAKRWDMNLEHLDIPTILTEWKKAPDQRIGQLLINLGMLEDSIKVWVDEEDNILREQGVMAREYTFWGRRLNDKKELLPKTEWLLIKDMDIEHIKAILQDVEEGIYSIPDYYLDIFKEELEIRRNLTMII